MPPDRHRPLNKSAIEDLSDARLILETVTHNIQAAVRSPTDPDQALASAITMLEQALATLTRIRVQRG